MSRSIKSLKFMVNRNVYQFTRQVSFYLLVKDMQNMTTFCFIGEPLHKETGSLRPFPR